MKSVILHIGLPKTATTTLQKIFFPNVLNAHYAGKFYAKKNNELVRLMQKSLDCSLRDNDFKRKFISKINKLSEDKILISEEMICVDTEKSTWQEKISRIKWLFDSDEVVLDRVLIVYREPVQASYSFYVECYNILRGEYKTYLDFVENSNQAKIYNLPKVMDVLAESIGINKVETFSYDDICARPGGIENILSEMGLNIKQVQAAFENNKRKDGETYFSNKETLKDLFLRYRIFKMIIRVAPTWAYRGIGKSFDKIKVRKETKVMVSDSERDRAAALFYSEDKVNKKSYNNAN